ncbi:MAG: GAF domain-containing protein [Stigonema ocellatum SAG 48.90 = DSM 106950]|nr:GAF domain-containing protein [Stigonema ocellatum SAG 48.90 = DSM 106950]
MTEPFSQKQARQKKFNPLQRHKHISEQPTRLYESPGQERLKRQKWSLKTKVTVWALAVSMLPVLTLGAATYYLESELVTKQIPQARLLGATGLVETELAIHRQLSLLFIATGATTVFAGAVAAMLARSAIRPVLNTAAVSTTIVNRLRLESESTSDPMPCFDESDILETNISFINEQLPALLWKQEAEAERTQLLMNITRSIWKSFNEVDVLNITVEEIRKAFRVDRVTIFRFNTDWDGTFVAESVAVGFPKTLWSTVKDPCFESGYVQQYHNGRVRAIDDIYQANLTDCHIGLLERFAVKSNLIAPILKDNQLFGLLIAHQCSEPRNWQQSEIDLFAQISTQVGFALNYAVLLEQVDTKADQAQVFIDITRRIRQSLNEEDVLKATVEEVRKTLSADRVLVYGFDSNWYGTVIAESVLPGFPKALRAKIKDPCFLEGYVEKYRAGRVQATNNIYEALLTDCYIKQLEPFGVKANLVASILKDDQLFGLLIAHQCSQPRDWRQSEIDLFAQIATQVGFALDHARLLQRIDAEGVRTQLLMDLTRSIRKSLNEEDVLKTTVEEVRKALSADRVLVYGFDSNWYGTVIAESVVPGFPKALRAKIKDPCFAKLYIMKYQTGRVQATNNIYQAGLSDCYIKQLEAFAVKANLVAPILKDDQLFGLLIAHQCSEPRNWQQTEIDLLAQIATQVGFALDHARLLNQVDQAYQAASSAQRQQQEAFQRQVSELLRSSEVVVQTLSTEVALNQMEFVSSAYDQIQIVADSAQGILASTQQVELLDLDLSQRVKDEHESMSRILDSISAQGKTFVEAAQKLSVVDLSSQKLSEMVNLMSHVGSQMKLQVMHTALEASRTPEAGQKFGSLADNILSLVKQLDSNITLIEPLVAEIQTQTNEVIAQLNFGTQLASRGTELAEPQQNLDLIVTLSDKIKTLVSVVNQTAVVQVEASAKANQSILESINVASHSSAQLQEVTDSLTNLAKFAQDLKEVHS